MTAKSTAVPDGSRPLSIVLVASTFLAALGPMVTVPGLRHLIMVKHAGAPASLHLFVALGMLGGAVGAPLLARRADHQSNLVKLAVSLALVEALVEALVPHSPTLVLFALRPLHGAASMGLLALLFAQVRRRGTAGLSRGAAASIVALALGPALGGVLVKHGAMLPFALACATSLALIPLLVAGRSELVGSEPRTDRRERQSLGQTIAHLRAPLTVLATQRLAIGGLVATWAIRAREVFQMSDAKVGASFSVFLFAFAATTLFGGKRLTERRSLVTCGGMTLGLAFVGLAVAPRSAAFALLAVAGIGASLAYAPSLARIAELSNEATRVSAMAVAHAAGATGMIVGPLAGAAFDRIFCSVDSTTRASAFLCVVGTIHAMATAILNSSRAPEEAAHPGPSSLKEERRTT